MSKNLITKAWETIVKYQWKMIHWFDAFIEQNIFLHYFIVHCSSIRIGSYAEIIKSGNQTHIYMLGILLARSLNYCECKSHDMRILYAQSIWHFLLCTADEITRRFTHWTTLKRRNPLQKLLNGRPNHNKYPWNVIQETWMGSNFLVREKLEFLFHPEKWFLLFFLVLIWNTICFSNRELIRLCANIWQNSHRLNFFTLPSKSFGSNHILSRVQMNKIEINLRCNFKMTENSFFSLLPKC